MICKLVISQDDKSKQPSVCIMLEDIETELVFLDSHASRSGTEDTEADCTLVIFRSVTSHPLTLETGLGASKVAMSFNDNTCDCVASLTPAAC